MTFSFQSLCVLLLCCGCASASVSTQPVGYDVRAFGASPDGKTSATRQIQAAIDACAAAGGGTVIVPAGQYVTGTLWMKSNITLEIEPGAILLGSQDQNEFPKWASDWEGPKVPKHFAPLIAGENLENVSIVGRGTIDARGEMWWAMQKHAKSPTGAGEEIVRPRTLRLVHSRNIRVQGITIKRSPYWTISPLACDNVTVDGVTILNPPDSPNTDGINPESCRNVHISNCHIDVGDDCITLKSGKETDGRRELWPTENVTITNCTLLHGHGGVVFGSEMSGSIRNVVISNCLFIGTDRGLRFKSRRGRGGVIEDVRADNIIMKGVLCPLSINLFYGSGAPDIQKITDQTPAPVDDSTPRFRRFRFSNITARDVKYAAAYIMGLPEMHADDIALDNAVFYLDPENTAAGAPDMAPGQPKLARAGFIAQRVDRLSLRNVEVVDQLGPALSIDDASHLVLSDFTARTDNSNGPVLKLNNIRGALIHDCSAPAGAKLPIHITGKDTSGIRVRGNDFGDAARSVSTNQNLSQKSTQEGSAPAEDPVAKSPSESK